MRNLAELNINQGGRPVARPRPSAKLFARLEKLVGTSLPDAYVQLLNFSNGGHPELDTFTVRSGSEWAVNRFFYLDSDTNKPENIFWSYRNRWCCAPQAILPIANDGEDNFICLDLSHPPANPVVVWVHDDPTLPLLSAADSFEEFIDSLRLNPDYI